MVCILVVRIQRVAAGNFGTFSKERSIVPLYITYTRALTFENWCVVPASSSVMHATCSSPARDRGWGCSHKAAGGGFSLAAERRRGGSAQGALEEWERERETVRLLLHLSRPVPAFLPELFSPFHTTQPHFFSRHFSLLLTAAASYRHAHLYCFTQGHCRKHRAACRG